jgi:hypothetical protein
MFRNMRSQRILLLPILVVALLWVVATTLVLAFVVGGAAIEATTGTFCSGKIDSKSMLCHVLSHMSVTFLDVVCCTHRVSQS